MIESHIEDHKHISFMTFFNKFFKVALCAERRIDAIIVDDIILMIGRGIKDRCKPDPLYPERVLGKSVSVIEIIQTVDNAPEIPDPVSVAVGKRTDKDLIKYPVVVIGLIDLLFCRTSRKKK